MKKAMFVLMIALAAALPLAAQYNVKIIDCPQALVTRIWGINDNGTMVGVFQDSNGKAHAMIYRNGACENLQPLLDSQFLSSQGYGINNRGDIVGAQAGRGFLIRNGSVSYFDFPGAVGTTPQAISDAGVIVGWYQTEDDGPLYGFKSDADGNLTELTLPFDGVADVLPWGVNARGDISGDWDSDNTTLGHAFLLPKNGEPVSFDMPASLAAPMGTWGGGVNDRGDLVGYFQRAEDPNVATGFAVLGARIVLIESPTPYLTTLPSAINNKRVIVGNIRDANGRHGFIATPVKQVE